MSEVDTEVEDFFAGIADDDVVANDVVVSDGDGAGPGGLRKPDQWAGDGDGHGAPSPAGGQDVDADGYVGMSAADVVQHGARIPEHWRDTYGERVAIDEQSSEFLFVVLITIPDETRCEVPVMIPADQQQRVDLSAIEKMTAADVKKLVTETLPDDQLQVLFENEFHPSDTSNHKTPRRAAAVPIQAEINRRQPADCVKCGQPVNSYARWLSEKSSDPFSCRVIASAIAIGDGDPELFLVDRDGPESDALELVWQYIGERDVAVCDWQRTWRTLAVRSIALDCRERKTALPMLISCRAIDHGHPHRDLNAIADAYGLSAAPHVAGSAMIYHAFKERQFIKLSEMVGNQLETERAILLAERTVF